MDRILKKTQIILLMFAGLAFTAHNIIPHDHHITDSLASKEETCPSSNGSAGHHHTFPVHCHAFNDLTSEKVTISFVPDKIQTRDIGISNLYDPIAAELQILFISNIEFREPVPDQKIIESSQLRAPPFLG